VAESLGGSLGGSLGTVGHQCTLQIGGCRRARRMKHYIEKPALWALEIIWGHEGCIWGAIRRHVKGICEAGGIIRRHLGGGVCHGRLRIIWGYGGRKCQKTIVFSAFELTHIPFRLRFGKVTSHLTAYLPRLSECVARTVGRGCTHGVSRQAGKNPSVQALFG